MKLRKVSTLAGLVAAAAFSGQAMALSPAVTPDLVVNISGASAQQKTLGALLSSFCTAGSLTEYRDDPTSGSDGKKWRSYFCTLDGANPNVPASLAGLDVLFNNRSGGGSIWGVVPVARGWAVEYLNIFSGNCTSTGSGTETCTWDTDRATGLDPFAAGTNGFECPFEPYAAGGPTYVGSINVHTGTTAESTVCLRSDGGVSDVEPALFTSSENFPGFTGGPLNSSDPALTVKSEYGVIFGVSITDNAYKHLQVNQGLASYADIANDPVVTGDAARPSLPLAAIRSLLWENEIEGLGSFQELDNAIAAPAGGPSGFMAVCRRVIGSGTQAAQNAFIFNNPCTGTSALKMISDNNTIDGNPGFIGTRYVQNNSGSGDVIDCQNDAISGTLLGAPIDAIGFNAIEKGEAGNSWKYVKIDGVDPTVANAIAGKYTHVFEQTIQWPTATTSGLALAALDMVAIASGDPTVMTSAGLGGVAALPANGFDWETQSPVLRGGRNGDSCRAFTLDKDD